MTEVELTLAFIGTVDKSIRLVGLNSYLPGAGWYAGQYCVMGYLYTVLG